MQICMGVKYMIDLFLHIMSLWIFLHELKSYVQVYKPSVILEPIVHADTKPNFIIKTVACQFA